jgi:hypothetical protein
MNHAGRDFASKSKANPGMLGFHQKLSKQTSSLDQSGESDETSRVGF